MCPRSYLLHILCLIIPQVATSTVATVTTANRTCGILVSMLPGKVFVPKDAAYQSSEASYAYVQEQIQSPSCIVKPSSASDISSAIKTLVDSSTAFAIRSGGHASNRGFSNVDGGITLDLTAINSVVLLDDDVTVSIGTGATWAEVYPVLDARGRSLNGGRASGVGVGGFLSGGNICFFFFAELHWSIS